MRFERPTRWRSDERWQVRAGATPLSWCRGAIEKWPYEGVLCRNRRRGPRVNRQVRVRLGLSVQSGAGYDNLHPPLEFTQGRHLFGGCGCGGVGGGGGGRVAPHIPIPADVKVSGRKTSCARESGAAQHSVNPHCARHQVSGRYAYEATFTSVCLVPVQIWRGATRTHSRPGRVRRRESSRLRGYAVPRSLVVELRTAPATHPGLHGNEARPRRGVVRLLCPRPAYHRSKPRVKISNGRRRWQLRP